MHELSIPNDWRPTTMEERDRALRLVEQLNFALDFEPAINSNALQASAAKLDIIRNDNDRKNVGQLRADILAAKKQVVQATEESIKRAFERHKAQKARQNAYLMPLESALAVVDSVIEMDLQEQARIAEETRAKLQAEADAKAKAEQQAREAEAARVLAIEREARMAAEKAQLEAKAKINAEIARAREREDRAKSEKAREKAASEREAMVERLRQENAILFQKRKDAEEREAQAKERAAEVAAIPIQAEHIEREEIKKTDGVRVMKAKYKGRVVDIDALPVAYLMPRVPNQKMIDAACAALGLETRIAGVEVYLENGGIATKGR